MSVIVEQLLRGRFVEARRRAERVIRASEELNKTLGVLIKRIDKLEKALAQHASAMRAVVENLKKHE